jgi:hypothetical protein
MDIDFDRRHAFYFDTDGNIRPLSPYRLDRLWRGEPDAAMPELGGQRIRFAILHIERFTSPPRVPRSFCPCRRGRYGALPMASMLRQGTRHPVPRATRRRGHRRGRYAGR